MIEQKQGLAEARVLAATHRTTGAEKKGNLTPTLTSFRYDQ